MDTRGTRRELADSVRILAGDERWLFAGLVGGAIGSLIWIAGTGVAVDRVASGVASAFSTDPAKTEIAFLAVLWVFLPSLVAVRYVVGKLTNLRGNIEQCYRFDRPLVLLALPLALVLLTLGAAVVEGAAGSAVLVAVGVANVFLLIRAVAYGYRVYSFSHPRLLQVVLFAAAVVVSLGVISRTASLAGQSSVVDTVATHYDVNRTVMLGPLTAQLLALAGATVPGILALAYVWVQLFASLVVRIRRPDVPRSAIRAGQRYPQVVQPGTSRRLAMGTVAGKAATDGNPADAEGASAAGSDGGQQNGSATGPGQRGRSTDEDFGETRVYTPPPDDDGAVIGGDSTVKSELCPICGATYEADAGHSNCPNCNAILDRE